MLSEGPEELGKFCEKICHQFPQILSRLTKPQGQIFVRREIWQICQFTRHDLKENVNQENLISILSRSISIRSPLKLFLSCAAIKRWRWKMRTSVCCITILTQNTTITVFKFTFQLSLQDQVLLNLYRLKQSTALSFGAFIFMCPVDGACYVW